MKLEAKNRIGAAKLECKCITANCVHSALTKKQQKLDIDGDGKIDGEDLKKVREGELATSTAKSTNPPKETIMEAKARLTASTQTQITAAKTAQVKFKDGSVHKVSFFSDPNKRKGNFILKSPDLPSLKFMLENGSYVVYIVGSQRLDIDKASRFDTKTAEASDAYMKGIKKFWKAV